MLGVLLREVGFLVDGARHDQRRNPSETPNSFPDGPCRHRRGAWPFRANGRSVLTPPGHGLSQPRAVRLDSPAMDRFRRFDEAYYHRFYDSPQTRVTSPEEHANLAEYVFAFARYNKVEVKSVLDVGAGIGLWKHWIEKNQKGIQYTGTEVS